MCIHVTSHYHLSGYQIIQENWYNLKAGINNYSNVQYSLGVEKTEITSTTMLKLMFVPLVWSPDKDRVYCSEQKCQEKHCKMPFENLQ